jgi:predicted MFS family arabinose efflux permease
MRAVFGHPRLRPIMLALMVWSIAGGFFVALYTLFCLRTLALPEQTFGVIVAIGGIGSLAGALISRRLVASIGLGRAMIVSSVISVCAGLLIPLASGSHVVVLLFLGGHQLVSDCFAVAFVVQATTLRQTVLPKEVLGRANAAVHICTAGIMPIAALVAGVLAELATIRDAVWIGTAIALVVPAFLWPLRDLRDMPEAQSSTEMARVAQG